MKLMTQSRSAVILTARQLERRQLDGGWCASDIVHANPAARESGPRLFSNFLQFSNFL